MIKSKLSIIAAIVAVIGTSVTVGVLSMKGNEQATEAPPIITAVQVKVINPKKGVLERLCVQPGSVQSFESVRLFAKVPGYLDSQTVDIGARVKKDDVLATVYVPDIKATVERNEAAVEKTQAKLEQMQARVEVSEANLNAAEAEIVQAEAKMRSDTATLKYRTIQLGRMRELVKNSAVEERIYDESRERHDAAFESENASRAAIVTTKAKVVACRARIKEAKADVIETKAEIKLALAELKRSKVDLDFATIKAPFTGVITRRFMNPGDFIKAADGSPNIEPLFTIDRTDLFRVVVLLPERDVRFVRDGTTATIELDALPGLKLPLTLSRFSFSLDKRTRLMHIEFDLKNTPKGEIYNDMYGQVTILLERGTDLLSIPSACLANKTGKGDATVFVVRSGRAEKVDVRLGMDSGVRVAVLEGLSRDDQVILNPNDGLSEQPAVIPVLTKD